MRHPPYAATVPGLGATYVAGAQTRLLRARPQRMLDLRKVGGGPRADDARGRAGTVEIETNDTRVSVGPGRPRRAGRGERASTTRRRRTSARRSITTGPGGSMARRPGRPSRPGAGYSRAAFGSAVRRGSNRPQRRGNRGVHPKRPVRDAPDRVYHRRGPSVSSGSDGVGASTASGEPH